MMLYLRAHRAPVGLSASVALVVLAWWLADQVIPMPALLHGRAETVPFPLLFATLFAPVTAHLFGGPALKLEWAARRRLLVPDLVLLVCLLAPPLLVAVVAKLTQQGEFGLALARNVTLYVGFAVALVALGSQVAAAAVPLGYFLATGTLGGTVNGSPQWWAVVRWPGEVDTAWIGLAVLLVGFGWFQWRIRRRPRSVASAAPATRLGAP